MDVRPRRAMEIRWRLGTLGGPIRAAQYQGRSVALTSTITAYDAKWPSRYRLEAARIRPIFGHALVDIHHVGSTAIPDLAAKPEIDILVVVDDVEGARDWTDGLSALGYIRGRDHSPGHLFYRRNVERIRTHKVHVCTGGHVKAGEMLGFRDYLREHPAVRRRYEELKLKLQAENTRGIGEYLDGKAPFIECVLKAMDR